MTRPRCSVFIASSLDGFIARRDGALDWLDAVQIPGEDYGYAEFFASVDTVLLGRKTWEVVRGFEKWPYEGKTVLVATHSAELPPSGVQFVRGDLAAAVARLVDREPRRIYVDGGETIRALLTAGIVDDITLSIVPRILGDGIRLFDVGLPETGLRLLDSRSWASGLVQLRYQVERSKVTPVVD